MKTVLENRLLSPHNALTKAFTMNVRFLRGFSIRSVKTGHLYPVAGREKVKTEKGGN